MSNNVLFEKSSCPNLVSETKSSAPSRGEDGVALLYKKEKFVDR